MSRLSDSAPASQPRFPEDEDLESIVAIFSSRLEEMGVEERNDKRLIEEAEERTADWYGRTWLARGADPMTAAQRGEVTKVLERQAPGLVAKHNADRLIDDLVRLGSAIDMSGLKLQEERRLRSEIEALRRDLLRDGHYHKEHDDAMMRMAALVRKAAGAWADNHLGLLERYLGRDRWWLL